MRGMRGRYVKYSEKVLDCFSSGEDVSLFLPLVKLLSEYMEKLCEECMENKMICTLRPMCPDRRWLSLLIKIGADERDLPKYCYKVRLNEVKALLGKVGHIHFGDAVLQIEVFLNLLSGGRSRLIDPLRSGDIERFVEGLVAEFKRHLLNVTLLTGDGYILLLSDGNVFFFNLLENIVLINPEEKRFTSVREFVDLVLAVREHYALPLEVEEDFKGFPRVTLRLPHRPDLESILEKFVGRVMGVVEYVDYFCGDNCFTVEIEFNPVSGNPPLRFKDALYVLERMKALYQEFRKEPLS